MQWQVADSKRNFASLAALWIIETFWLWFITGTFDLSICVMSLRLYIKRRFENQQCALLILWIVYLYTELWKMCSVVQWKHPIVRRLLIGTTSVSETYSFKLPVCTTLSGCVYYLMRRNSLKNLTLQKCKSIYFLKRKMSLEECKRGTEMSV